MDSTDFDPFWEHYKGVIFRAVDDLAIDKVINEIENKVRDQLYHHLKEPLMHQIEMNHELD